MARNGARQKESERRQKWESRTLQGIKSLFVTGTVMKILWLVEPMGREAWRGGRRQKWLDSPTPGDLWNTNQPANMFAHAGAKLPWDGEALRVSTFVSALDSALWALPAARGGGR